MLAIIRRAGIRVKSTGYRLRLLTTDCRLLTAGFLHEGTEGTEGIADLRFRFERGIGIEHRR
jgi:hypothetical protein